MPLTLTQAEIADKLGANVFGRLDYAKDLLEEGRFQDARRELEAVLRFLPQPVNSKG